MDNKKRTQTNSTNEPVHCKDCQHLILGSEFYKVLEELEHNKKK